MKGFVGARSQGKIMCYTDLYKYILGRIGIVISNEGPLNQYLYTNSAFKKIVS